MRTHVVVAVLDEECYAFAFKVFAFSDIGLEAVGALSDVTEELPIGKCLA